MPSKKDKITSYCNVCKASSTIIKGRSNICNSCKASIIYIARNAHYSEDKISNLRLRLVALEISKSNPKMAIAEALRQAIKLRDQKTGDEVAYL